MTEEGTIRETSDIWVQMHIPVKPYSKCFRNEWKNDDIYEMGLKPSQYDYFEMVNMDRRATWNVKANSQYGFLWIELYIRLENGVNEYVR